MKVGEVQVQQERPFDALIRLQAAYQLEGTQPTRPPKVLVFGDSVMVRVSKNDVRPEPLGQLLLEGLEAVGSSGLVLAGSAYHSSLFLGFLKCLSRLPFKPKCLVLPLNIRSFTTQWASCPHYFFPDEFAWFRRFEADPRVDIGSAFIPNPSDEQMQDYREISVALPGFEFKKVGEVLDFINSEPKDEETFRARKRCIFSFHYMVRLELNDRIHDLVKIFEWATQEGIAVHSYFTPINFEAGLRYCGPSFVEALNANKDVIRRALSSVHFEVPFDFSQMFGSMSYFSMDDATEHLEYAARRSLSEAIIKSMAIGGMQTSLSNDD